MPVAGVVLLLTLEHSGNTVYIENRKSKLRNYVIACNYLPTVSAPCRYTRLQMTITAQYSPDAFRTHGSAPTGQSVDFYWQNVGIHPMFIYTVDASETSSSIRGPLLYDLVEANGRMELKEEQKSGIAFSGHSCPDGWDIHGEHLVARYNAGYIVVKGYDRVR